MPAARIRNAAKMVDFPALFGPTKILKWRSERLNLLNALNRENSTLTKRVASSFGIACRPYLWVARTQARAAAVPPLVQGEISSPEIHWNSADLVCRPEAIASIYN
jgi:hypothetical protein